MELDGYVIMIVETKDQKTRLFGKKKSAFSSVKISLLELQILQ